MRIKNYNNIFNKYLLKLFSMEKNMIYNSKISLIKKYLVYTYKD